MTTMTTAAGAEYPVRFDVDYPEVPRNRVTVFFRIFLVIPILIVLTLVSGGPGWSSGDRNMRPGDQVNTPFGSMESERGPDAGGAAAAGGLVIAPTVLMLLFRRKYPRWWFDWNVELERFGNRVGAYVLLLRDEYPSTDEEQAVHLEIDYPDAQQLNRWLPLVKWFLAIPHYLVLVFFAFGVLFAVLLAWFAILVTGRFPPGLFAYIVGVMRWGMRVAGYAFLLVTDRYPPFSTR